MFDNSNQRMETVFIASFVIQCHLHLLNCSHQFSHHWRILPKEKRSMFLSHILEILEK